MWSKIVCGLTLVILLGCDAYWRISRQIPTFADLYSSADELQLLVEKHGSVSDAEAYRIIRKRNSGLDSWGNPIVFRAKSSPQFSFLLLSLGSDGKLDVDDIESYFSHPREVIVGQFDRDIVFRDGKPVTIASDK